MDRQEAARRLIVNDIIGAMNLISTCGNDTLPFFMLGGLTYYATIISGALDWCEKANMATECYADRDIVEKLRAKAKLYASDNVIPLSEQKTLMKNIIEIEKQYWIDLQAKSGKWRPHFLIPDIGTYSVNRHLIGNTLEYAYEFSPLNPQKQAILDALGGKKREDSSAFQFAVQLGNTLRGLYKQLTGEEYSLNCQNTKRIAVEQNDFKMSSRHFFRKSNSVYAFNLCCRINYLIEMLFPLCSDNPLLAFRMMYITFYHLQFDLKNLGLEEIRYNMPFRNTTFRNAMAHYSLYGKISEKEINENVVGFGLFEKFFNCPFQTVNSAVITELKQTRDSLEQYVVI